MYKYTQSMLLEFTSFVLFFCTLLFTVYFISVNAAAIAFKTRKQITVVNLEFYLPS